MPTGSQGKVTYGMISGVPVAIKSCKYDKCLILESQAMQQIYKHCPEVSNFFPKFIELTPSGKLIMTRVKNGIKLSDLFGKIINSQGVENASKIILNLCFISLCVLERVRITTGIVHNDLHTSNIIIIPTDQKFFSITLNGKLYKYKTYGVLPVIIDFGYAHVGFNVIGSLQNSDLGYTLEEQDCLADARLLLFSAANSFDDRTRKIIETIFKPLNLTKEGWFPPEILSNAYDELYTIAGKQYNQDDQDDQSTKSVDATLTLLVNSMGNLLDKRCITPCCTNCYYSYETTDVYFSDESSEDIDTEWNLQISCICTDKISNIFNKIYDKISNNKVLDEALFREASLVFKPVIVQVLDNNRTIKRNYYNKLTVSTSLDVIDEYYRRVLSTSINF